jgi:hypothetical protein
VQLLFEKHFLQTQERPGRWKTQSRSPRSTLDDTLAHASGFSHNVDVLSNWLPELERRMFFRAASGSGYRSIAAKCRTSTRRNRLGLASRAVPRFESVFRGHRGSQVGQPTRLGTGGPAFRAPALVRQQLLDLLAISTSAAGPPASNYRGSYVGIGGNRTSLRPWISPAALGESTGRRGINFFEGIYGWEADATALYR